MQNRLRELRKSKRWTQARLAEESGVNRTIIARYETGQTGMNQKNLIRIAGALNVPVDDVLKGGQADGATA